jgi:hypothetical protein
MVSRARPPWITAAIAIVPIAVLVAMACAAESVTPAAGPVAAATPLRSTPVHVGDRRYAVVTAVGVVSECSNAGGYHYLLEVADPGPGDPHLVELGAHGWRAELGEGERFLAELAPPGPSWLERRRGLDTWCAGDLAQIDGAALRVLDVDGDPVAALAQVAAHGWPAGPVLTPGYDTDLRHARKPRHGRSLLEPVMP